jgi:hypothetical protein
MIGGMDPTASTLPAPEQDEPIPLPPARGRGFLMERLFTVNALVSLGMLAWSAMILRNPRLARRTWQALRRAFPGFVGGEPSARPSERKGRYDGRRQ